MSLKIKTLQKASEGTQPKFLFH